MSVDGDNLKGPCSNNGHQNKQYFKGVCFELNQWPRKKIPFDIKLSFKLNANPYWICQMDGETD